MQQSSIGNIEFIIESQKEDNLGKAQEYIKKYPNLLRAAIVASLIGDRYNEDKEGVEATRIIGLGEILDFFGELSGTSVRDMAHILEAGIDRPPLETIKACEEIAGNLPGATRQLRAYEYRTIYYVEAPLGRDDLWVIFRFYFDLDYWYCDEESSEDGNIKLLVTLYVHREMEEEEAPHEEEEFYFSLDDEESVSKVKKSVQTLLASKPTN